MALTGRPSTRVFQGLSAGNTEHPPITGDVVLGDVPPPVPLPLLLLVPPPLPALPPPGRVWSAIGKRPTRWGSAKEPFATSPDSLTVAVGSGAPPHAHRRTSGMTRVLR